MLVGSFIPTAGLVVDIIGLILVFIAVKYIADVAKNEEIFKNYLLNFIFSIIAIIAAIAIMLMAFGAMGGWAFITSLQSAQITDFNSFMNYFSNFSGLIAGCVAALFVGWILLVLGAVYYRRSYNLIADATKVDLFRTTGFVYFIGAILLIIAVGAIIILIAKILEIIAYFSLPEELPKPATEPAATPEPST
jgi:uncharacterized membrane protein